ncbi:MAG: ribose 5-phosphate isomerase B [Clostridia bacterium]|nr:ribose 5-phosphate isomerase B [Clostridia bacterium]
MIALASDHAGLPLKKEIIELLESMNLEYKDYGAYTGESCDYAIFGQKAANAVASGECERGILCCGTGIGISLAANKTRGIRCVVCTDCFSAKMSREHNDANMLALGARVVGGELARMIVKIWLETEFAGGRHQRRVDQIMAIEAGKDLTAL